MSLFTKFIGGIIFTLGLIITIYFPSSREFQPERLGLTGILFGFALMGAGIFLLIF
jgi:ABC-type Fe3+-siderophore transport system permease subunit